MRQKLTLVGHYAGTTGTIQFGGTAFEFENGSITLNSEAEEVAALTTYLRRNAQAYPDPSPELTAARKALEEDEDNGNGNGSDQKELPGSQGQPGGGQDHGGDSGSGPQAPSPDGGGGDAGPQAGPEGAPAQGGDQIATLGQVILELDHKVDDNWTAEGKPAVAAVATASGRADLTRAMIEEAVPEHRRAVE